MLTRARRFPRPLPRRTVRYAAPTYFLAPVPPSPEQVAREAARQAQREAERRVENGGLCCEAGTALRCVCRRAVSCPTHGQIHVGSHD